MRSTHIRAPCVRARLVPPPRQSGRPLLPDAAQECDSCRTRGPGSPLKLGLLSAITHSIFRTVTRYPCRMYERTWSGLRLDAGESRAPIIPTAEIFLSLPPTCHCMRAIESVSPAPGVGSCRHVPCVSPGYYYDTFTLSLSQSACRERHLDAQRVWTHE